MVRLDQVTGMSIENENIALPGMYIQLNTRTQIQIGKSENADALANWTAAKESYLYQRILFESEQLSKFKEPFYRPLSVVEMIEYYPRLVLVGAPGSGKSTFLQYLTICMAGEFLQRKEANLDTLNEVEDGLAPRPWPHGTLFPIYLELRSFVSSRSFSEDKASGRAENLLDYIASTLLPGRDPDIRMLIQNETSKVLLMLDGLDEIQEANENRERLREVIADFVSKYPKCRIIVTSRPYAYQEDKWRLNHVGFNEVQIADLDKSQIRKFIFHWHQSLNESIQVSTENISERAIRLAENIEKNTYLKSLVVSPLLLSLVVALGQRSGGVLPVDRAELYEESVNLLLDRWNAQKGLVIPLLTMEMGIDLETLRAKLGEIAFETHRGADMHDITGISYDTLYEAFKAIANVPTEAVDSIMKYLHQRSGILVAESPTQFHFVHRSFQEYLAARYLVRRMDYPDSLANLTLANPHLWREVLLFAARRAVAYRERDVWDLASRLCSVLGSGQTPLHDNWQGVFLAGLILLETKSASSEFQTQYSIVLEQIRSLLVEFLKNSNIALSERYEVGLILDYLGDPRPGVGVDENNIPNIKWVEIPAGEFLMGSSPEDKEAYANEVPQHLVELGTYHISKYPITVAQFRTYIRSTESASNLANYGQTRIQEESEDYQSNFPITGVDFYEAKSFCAWLSKKLQYEVRLPTQEEWEKAARGKDGRFYPWGNEFQSDKCNVNNNVSKLCAVGLFPDGASPYGVLDMCGNVWEWTSSMWQAESGQRRELGKFHEIRGGAFSSKPAITRCAYHGHEATAQLSDQGFRVVTKFVKQGT